MSVDDIEADSEEVISEGSILIQDGFSFYKFIDALSNINDEIPLRFDPVNKILNISFMDAPRLCLMSIDIKEDVVETKDLKNLLKVKKDINVEINGSITGEQVCISLDDLKNLLKIKKETKKNIKLIFGDHYELKIEKNGSNGLGTVKKSLNYLDIKFEEISMTSLEGVDYPNEILINTAMLDDMFYESNNYSDVCTIETNKKGICFMEIGKIGRQEALYKSDILEGCNCNSSEISSHMYSFLNVIKNFLKIMKKDDIIKIYQRTGTPLKVVIELKKINTIINYYIACRVNEEEHDNGEEDF